MSDHLRRQIMFVEIWLLKDSTCHHITLTKEKQATLL